VRCRHGRRGRRERRGSREGRSRFEVHPCLHGRRSEPGISDRRNAARYSGSAVDGSRTSPIAHHPSRIEVNLFVANWKMHMTRAEARAYAVELSRIVSPGGGGREIVIAPPFTALDALGEAEGRWRIAAQNVAADAKGAFTGEVCARMLAE